MSKGKYILKINHNEQEDKVTTKRKIKGDKGEVILTVLLDIIGECFKNGGTKEDMYEIVNDIYDFVITGKVENKNG